jgi:hypothetical protein
MAKADHNHAVLFTHDGLVHCIAAVQVGQQVTHRLLLLLLWLLLLRLLLPLWFCC